jgi:geranylgeranyl diphosphate synthase type II
MDARAYLEERGSLVDRFLDAALPEASSPPQRLHQAMRYILFPAGKRLRPGLAFAGCEAVGSPPEVALPLAAAVELVHTYSLVHDDLPCMDDDSQRRGRPTVHLAFDEATAVLAGDALLALAFQVLAASAGERVLAADAGERTEWDGGPVAAIDLAATLEDLAASAGSTRLVGGQSDDLRFTSGGPDEAERVESVHLRKSAALIATSVAGGARLGGADPETVAALRLFGEEVGVAFQIADDLLDQDRSEPCSLVRVLGSQAARARSETLLDGALGRLRSMGERAEPLRELARYAVRREQ